MDGIMGLRERIRNMHTVKDIDFTCEYLRDLPNIHSPTEVDCRDIEKLHWIITTIVDEDLFLDKTSFKHLDCILQCIDCFLEADTSSWEEPNVCIQFARLVKAFLDVITNAKVTQDNEHLQADLLRSLKRSITTLGKKKKTIRKFLVDQVSLPFLDVTGNTKIALMCRIVALDTVNHILDGASRTARSIVQQKAQSQLLLLSRNLSQCGDHVFQANLVEMLYRLHKTENELNELVRHISPNKSVQELFINLQNVEFDQDSNYFLIELNKSLKGQQKVFSVICSKVVLGIFQLRTHETVTMQPLWVHFSMSSGGVTVCVDGSCINKGEDDTRNHVNISCSSTTVNRATLTRSKKYDKHNPFILTLSLQRGGKSTHMVNDEAFEYGDKLTICMRERTPDLKALHEKVLPFMYGDRYEGPADDEFNNIPNTSDISGDSESDIYGDVTSVSTDKCKKQLVSLEPRKHQKKDLDIMSPPPAMLGLVISETRDLAYIKKIIPQAGIQNLSSLSVDSPKDIQKNLQEHTKAGYRYVVPLCAIPSLSLISENLTASHTEANTSHSCMENNKTCVVTENTASVIHFSKEQTILSEVECISTCMQDGNNCSNAECVKNTVSETLGRAALGSSTGESQCENNLAATVTKKVKACIVSIESLSSDRIVNLTSDQNNEEQCTKLSGNTITPQVSTCVTGKNLNKSVPERLGIEQDTSTLPRGKEVQETSLVVPQIVQSSAKRVTDKASSESSELITDSAYKKARTAVQILLRKSKPREIDNDPIKDIERVKKSTVMSCSVREKEAESNSGMCLKNTKGTGIAAEVGGASVGINTTLNSRSGSLKRRLYKPPINVVEFQPPDSIGEAEQPDLLGRNCWQSNETANDNKKPKTTICKRSKCMAPTVKVDDHVEDAPVKRVRQHRKIQGKYRSEEPLFGKPICPNNPHQSDIDLFEFNSKDSFDRLLLEGINKPEQASLPLSRATINLYHIDSDSSDEPMNKQPVLNQSESRKVLDDARIASDTRKLSKNAKSQITASKKKPTRQRKKVQPKIQSNVDELVEEFPDLIVVSEKSRFAEVRDRSTKRNRGSEKAKCKKNGTKVLNNETVCSTKPDDTVINTTVESFTSLICREPVDEMRTSPASLDCGHPSESPSDLSSLFLDSFKDMESTYSAIKFSSCSEKSLLNPGESTVADETAHLFISKDNKCMEADAPNLSISKNITGTHCLKIPSLSTGPLYISESSEDEKIPAVPPKKRKQEKKKYLKQKLDLDKNIHGDKVKSGSSTAGTSVELDKIIPDLGSSSAGHLVTGETLLSPMKQKRTACVVTSSNVSFNFSDDFDMEMFPKPTGGAPKSKALKISTKLSDVSSDTFLLLPSDSDLDASTKVQLIPSKRHKAPLHIPKPIKLKDILPSHDSSTEETSAEENEFHKPSNVKGNKWQAVFARKRRLVNDYTKKIIKEIEEMDAKRMMSNCHEWQLQTDAYHKGVDMELMKVETAYKSYKECDQRLMVLLKHTLTCQKEKRIAESNIKKCMENIRQHMKKHERDINGIVKEQILEFDNDNMQLLTNGAKNIKAVLDKDQEQIVKEVTQQVTQQVTRYN